jgi:hypothetical protein
MSDIVDDIKIKIAEITGSLGLNLTADDSRIKHNGSGVFTIQSNSTAGNALNFYAPNGGINIETGSTSSGLNLNGNVTITGDLHVEGETVSTNVTIFTSTDPIFYLNSGITSHNTNDIGFVGDRGAYDQNVGFIWDESNKEWATIGTSLDGSTNVINPIDSYKALKTGGLKVVTDTSNGTATQLDVNINGAINLQTSDATNGIKIGTTPTGIPITIGATGSIVTINGTCNISGGGGGGPINSDDITEGTTNLFFTPERAVLAIEADASLNLAPGVDAYIKHTSNNAGRNFTLGEVGLGSLILSGAKAGVDAIQLNALTTGGGIAINASTGGITIDSAGTLSLDSVTTSNFSVSGSGAVLTLETTGTSTSQTIVKSTGTGNNAVALTATAGGVSVSAIKSSTINVNGSAQSLTLSSTGGGAQQTIVSSAGTGTDAIDLTASAGGLSVTAATGMQVNNDITMGNSNNVIDYFYFKNSTDNTKWWRMYVDVDGNFNIDRYNGTTWVNKSTLA